MESLEEKGVRLPFPARSFARSGKVVALRIEGHSMTEAGIMDGDYVIIRRQPRVENGEIAAVSLAGEGTLKRWRIKGRRVRLEPANARFSDIPLGRGRGEVRIFGKLVGVVRIFGG